VKRDVTSIICLLAAISIQDARADDIVKQFVNHRKSFGNYKINLASNVTRTNPDGSVLKQNINSKWEIAGEKYFQSYSIQTDGKTEFVHRDNCTGCTEDGRHYSFIKNLNSRVVYCSVPPYNPYHYSCPLEIGLCEMGVLTPSNCKFDAILDSQYHKKWEMLDSGSASGEIILVRRSIDGEDNTLLKISSQKPYQLYYYEFTHAQGYDKIRSHYSSRNALFPSRVEIDSRNPNRNQTEVIQILNTEFNLPISSFTFTPEKVGLMRNKMVVINQAPDSKVRHEGGYWDGAKVIGYAPDPGEYVKNDNSPSPPAAMPISDNSPPWRWVLIVLAGMMTITALFFAVRGVRSRR
jgi:hypothetical protein